MAFRAVRLDESLLSTLIIDSIGLVDLVVILEKKLSIGLDLGAISRENFDTVNDMVLHVQELAGRK